ncbi:hypothetical protein [Actinomadura rupiterrae]|uniref:hypothetical protein n=1 Tax=Actinomadura rupiterrae TaxID=559627 RepID=UPI0020A4A4E2|nr:hypothetical protein [Actinomadura rupiterrae]MCP2340423.1 hypothetical protein [Actinomadura rupiterrae]
MKRMLRAGAAGVTLAALLATAPAASAADPSLHTVGLPFLWSAAGVDDVAAGGPDNVWFAGLQGYVCIPFADSCVVQSNGNPVVRRWTGSGWREYPINGWTGNGGIGHVRSAAGRTWISGDYTQPGFLARFDGTAFQKSPVPDGAKVANLDVGTGGAWIVTGDSPDYLGKYSIYQGDGGTWTRVPAPSDLKYIWDLKAPAADAVWAVGAKDRDLGGGGRGTPAIYRYDGRAWSELPAPPSATEIVTHIVPRAADDVWITMTHSVAHWNGASWTQTPVPSGGETFALDVDGTGTPWIGVRNGPDESLYRLTGSTWTKVTTPSGVAIRSVAAVPGTGTVWAGAAKGPDPAVLTTG